MGRYQNFEDNQGSKLAYFREQAGSAIFLGPAVFLLIFLVNSVRVPMGLLNFWAEDGVVFYSDVINKDFPQRLFTDTGAGGYLNLSGKLIAELVGLFKIDLAPIVNFGLVNLVYSILLLIIYKRLHPYFQNKVYLVVFLGFFVFVPIATFDSLATSINLHFFLLFSIFIIIFSNLTRPTVTGHLVIFITCLSDPLAILLFPAVLALIVYKKVRNSYIVNFFISLSIQLIAILYFFGDSTRSIGNDPSVAKTFYLFIDRVVGASLVPNWGFVDGQALESGQVPRVLIFRFIVGFLILMSILYLAFVARSIGVTQDRLDRNFLVGSLLLTSTTYWVVAGLFFNPEPRYAIFPSLCLALVFLMALDVVTVNLQNPSSSKKLIAITLVLFTSIFASAFQVSEIRNTDQDWKKQVEIGRAACLSKKALDFEVIIPPERNDLILRINCNDLE